MMNNINYKYSVVKLNNGLPQTKGIMMEYNDAIDLFNYLKEQDVTTYVWQYDGRRGLERDPRAKIIMSHKW